MRVSEMLTGSRGDIAIKLFGTDLKTLNQSAEQMVKVLEGIKGSEDVSRYRTAACSITGS